LKVFEENELFLRRAYLHTTLHCLYAHLWQMGERESARWHLACDIAVEYVIDSLEKPSTKRLLGWVRQQFYDKMRQEHILAAANIYELLADETPEQRNLLAKEFYCDDHGLWGETKKQAPMPGQTPPEEAQKKWEQIARQVQHQKDKSDTSEDASAEMLKIEITNRKNHRSYKEFLRKFAAFQEQLRCDIDNFDLNYYTYGLQIYGNLPLIEPLETREEYRIREFVIVVDSSYSTSGELIRGFLQETLHILLEEHAFSSAAKVHLIQCDERVQEDLLITSANQAREVLGQFEIKGGGGTDFRPAFT
jgi:predicted metal-dependent peptidase